MANTVNKRRVVVTGLGAVTPLGLDVPSTWNALLAGQSGVRPLTHFDASRLPTRIAASIPDFDPSLYLDVKEIRKNDVFLHYAMAAATQAFKDSGLVVTEENAERVGVAIGSGMGGLPLLEKTYALCMDLDPAKKGGPERIQPSFIPAIIINMASGIVAIKYGCKGPNISIVTACGTGAHNIGCAARMISYGDADVMIAGGAEMATTLLGVGGFAAARTISRRNDDPARASRPWDKDRDGFVIGEGAGVVVLEEYEHAKQRGATIYAELVGVGMSEDAHHATAPDPEGRGSALAMKNAIRDAGVRPEEIQYINAHATSTPVGDGLEVLAIKLALGEHAYKVAVSATKSMTGHLLGAAGAVEAIFTILSLRDQVAPPTINLDNPDEGCDLDFVPHTARNMKIDLALSNSFGFGGTNISLLFKKV
jgi:3-oxoacyl-[acyl-carrier-protein] synthase II